MSEAANDEEAREPDDRTPKGRLYHPHYAKDRLVLRGISGAAVDEVIDTTPAVPAEGEKLVHYNPEYGKHGLTVVLNTSGVIITAYQGAPRKSQLR